MNDQIIRAYRYKGIWYSESFPEEWAISHTEGTGPNDCENCLTHGCVDDIFQKYCLNCAEYVYEGTRDSPPIEYYYYEELPNENTNNTETETYTNLNLKTDFEAEFNYDNDYDPSDYLHADPYPDLPYDESINNYNSVCAPDYVGGYNDF